MINTWNEEEKEEEEEEEEETAKLCTIQNTGFAVDICMLDVRVLNGRIIVLHKKLLEELDGQGRLSNTSITNHHQFVCYLGL